MQKLYRSKYSVEKEKENSSNYNKMIMNNNEATIKNSNYIGNNNANMNSGSHTNPGKFVYNRSISVSALPKQDPNP